MKKLMETLIERLDRMIELLEDMRDEQGNAADRRNRAIPRPVPLIDDDSIPAPYYPQRIVPYPQPDQFTQRCSKCGMQVGGVMHMSCQDMDCPMGLGPLRCST